MNDIDDESPMKFTSAEDVARYVTEKFQPCGCADQLDILTELQRTLTWCGEDAVERKSWETLHGTKGAYYLIIKQLDELWLCDHGTSIRCPFLAADGRELLRAMNEFGLVAIADAMERRDA